MFAADDSATLTIDELTWLSASTLIENHHALSGSPTSDRSTRLLLRSVFHDSRSDIENDDEDEDEEEEQRTNGNPRSLSRHISAPTSTTPPRRAQGLSGMTSTTPGTNSPAGSSRSAGVTSPFLSGRQPITPPPTPPRRHLYPKYLSHDYSPVATPPSPSPSVSSSTLSSIGRTHQTEWIYRRPKSSSPAGSALMNRHRSASSSASCTPQLSRSPSISSRTHRDNATTPTRSSKHRQHAAAIPRPSSPVLISSTSQLVEAPSLDSVSRSPSVCSNVTGLRSAANASVSSLHSIRVSPLKNRVRGSSISSGANPTAGTFSGISPPPMVERCPSNTSTTSYNSTSTAIWSAIRAKSGTSTPERNRILKSIPSQSQIVLDSSVTPTFIASSISSLPISNRDLIPPKTPPKDRHTMSATPPLPPALPQKDKDRLMQRRDKFASAPPLPVPIVGVNLPSARCSSSAPGANSPSSGSSLHIAMGTSASSVSPSGGSSATIRISSPKSNHRTRNPRDRTTSLTSQCSITTSTTTHTAATTGTSSSSSSSRSHPDTPTTPLPVPVPGVYHYRNSSSTTSSTHTGTSPSYLHGLGGEKKAPPPPLPLGLGLGHHRHQRQTSTSSGISAGTAAAFAARSQAYAQLTGNTKRRRPSTSPGSETSSIYSHSHSRSHLPYSRQFGPGLGDGSMLGGAGAEGSSTGTLMPSAPSSTSYSPPTPLTPSLPPPPPPPFPAPHSSSVSLSHYGNSYVSRSPRTPRTSHMPHRYPSLPKSKSILTRTSSMSTKASAGGGGTVKSVKFVEIPEVHYRSGCFEEDGNEYVYGYGACGSDAHGCGDDGDDDGNLSAVGARGEGQEGIVLRECMGIDVEAIDMDIDTYLGLGQEEEEEKEAKMSFRRMQGLGWGFLSRGRKQEKDKEVDKEKENQKDDADRECITPTLEREQKKKDEKEKEKSSSVLGLKRLMSLAARKAPPPPLSLSISSPFPLGLRSPTQAVNGDTSNSNYQTAKKPSPSPPVSPSHKPAISGPYVLGSHLPSRSPPTHSPLPSPSSSLLHHPPHSIPASSSNTSLNRLNGNLNRRQYYHQSSASVGYGSTTSHRARSMRNTHRSTASATTASGMGINIERPVGPNIAGTRPKGIIDSDVPSDMLSLDAMPVPLKSAPSYESFRSARSYGGRSARSEVGSMKSARSAGGASVRSFRTWMGKVGANVGLGGRTTTGVAVAVAE